MLVTHCKLDEVTTDLAPASCWASSGWREHTGPTLLLVCGNTPGGEAGVWGRALCVNHTTLQGAMFDYIARARARKWAVVVADPHTDAAPHLHLTRLMQGPLASKERLLVVAHSYGAPCTLGMVWTPIRIVATPCRVAVFIHNSYFERKRLQLLLTCQSLSGFGVARQHAGQVHTQRFATD